MSILMDIRYALRLLFKAPRFTALTLLVLIGGLSISLFTFSFLYSVIYKPLPLPEGETVLTGSLVVDGNTQMMLGYEMAQVRETLDSFDELGVYSESSMRLTVADVSKNLPATYVEAQIFRFSRTMPLMGRPLQAADSVDGAPPVVVISHHTWQHELNGDPQVIGRWLELNGQRTTIVGVMPEGYHFPINSRLWLPLPASVRSPVSSEPIYIGSYFRLKPGVSLSAGQTELSTALYAVYRQRIQQESELSAVLETFPEAQLDGAGHLVFGFLNIIAFFILLLACINVGNLLLARAVERQQETAIRAALGAPSRRLIAQLMWEGGLITALGGLLSILLVTAALDYTHVALRSYLPTGIPFWWRWGMDGRTLLVALGFIGVTLFLACFLPAWRATRQDINAVLRDGTRGAQGKKAGRLSRLLVVIQVFLISTLMLVGSMTAFLLQHFINMDLGLDYGSDYQLVIRGSVDLPPDRYKTDEQSRVFFQTLVDRLEQQPGIADASMLTYFGMVNVAIDGEIYAREQDKPQIETMALIGDPEFYGPFLREGRHLDQRDVIGSQLAVVVSKSMANRYWPGESALGRRIQLTLDYQPQWFTVVGVVSDRVNGRSMFSKKAVDDEIYISGLQFTGRSQRLYFKFMGDPIQAEDRFYEVFFAMDRHLDPGLLRPAAKDINMVREMMQYVSNLTFGAGGFALLLALTGIYGLTANAVTQRTHEMGLRRAVGATDRQIVSLFLRQGSRQLLLGLALGVGAFALIFYVLYGLTDGMLAWHLFVLLAVVVSAGLSLVMLGAIYLPTRRSVALEPSTALRYE